MDSLKHMMRTGILGLLAAAMAWAAVRGLLAQNAQTAATPEPAASLPAFDRLPEKPPPPIKPPLATASHTIAILGDVAPTNQASSRYLKQAVEQLNLLRPDAVFTVGNLLPGYTRSGERYATAALQVQAALDQLKMPWHPCPGASDVISGTRESRDRRFEGLYEKYFGPLYYSVDAGNVHVIVLNSEEGRGKGNALSEEQLAWLKADLHKTFEAHIPKPNVSIRRDPEPHRTQYVIVLLHRPLWRIESKEFPSNWDRVHDMLVDFNRRPIVSVEGMNGGAAEARGPRVVGVYSGGTRAYSEEPTRDGIHYVVLGATAARLQQDAAVGVRHFTLLKFDSPPPPAADGLGVHPVVMVMGGVGPGGAAAGTVLPADVITLRERAVLDQIAAIPEDVLGIGGSLEQPAGSATQPANGSKPPEMRLLLGNPLDVPIDVELRMASARNLSTATLRENANPYAEPFDAPWQLQVPYLGRHLQPKTTERYQMTMTHDPQATHFPPPQVEFVVHWTHPRGRVHDVILKRKVPVVPRARVPLLTRTDGRLDDTTWDHAISGTTYSWHLRGDEPRKRAPDWELAADRQHVFLRFTVEDPVHSHWPGNDPRPKDWGGLPSDALFIAFAPAPDAKDARRIWLLPFDQKGPSLWTNTGFGDKQTSLRTLDPREGVKASLEKRDDGYQATLALPRKILFGGRETCVLNLGVHDNDEGAFTWIKSWASDAKGAQYWGKVSIAPPATQPATTTSRPATAP